MIFFKFDYDVRFYTLKLYMKTFEAITDRLFSWILFLDSQEKIITEK